MRLLITADLHYDIHRSREPVRRLARQAAAAGGDALVLLGDTAGRDMRVLRECLRLFDGFGGVKLLVPGNHCLWCQDGEDSLQRYERMIPELAAEEGFRVLDHQPLVRGGVALAGSIGWYDYSLRCRDLGIPVAFYRAKVAPGAARYLPEHRDLLRRHKDTLTERHLSIATQWMDGRYVRLPMSDSRFLNMLVDRLSGQLADLSRQAERILVFLHHLPFAELVPRGRPDNIAFVAGYMGSGRLGSALMGFPKVTHVYCGHSHWRGRQQIAHMSVINVGSTYTEKYLEVLDL